MRGVAIEAFGAQARVLELSLPDPMPGEVLVKVGNASVNGFDLAVVAGMLQGAMEHRFPVVLGKDFAGTVAAVGGDVTRLVVGDIVFGVVMKPYLGDGSFAEYVTVPEQYGIERLPDRLDSTTAGALGLVGSAALAAIDAVALRDGETVLVSGATGGVGALVVQYARRGGATVVATVRPGKETDFVCDLGASHVVDYTGDLTSQVRAIAADGLAAVVHLAGDPAGLIDLLAPGGRIASTVGYGSDQNPAAVAVMANPDAATLSRLADDVLAGRVRVPVGRTFQLSEVPTALGAFTAGTLGKFAVTI